MPPTPLGTHDPALPAPPSLPVQEVPDFPPLVLAVHFLQILLARGPVNVQTILRIAPEFDFSIRTLRRAKRQLAVVSYMCQRQRYWALPTQECAAFLRELAAAQAPADAPTSVPSVPCVPTVPNPSPKPAPTPKTHILHKSVKNLPVETPVPEHV